MFFDINSHVILQRLIYICLIYICMVERPIGRLFSSSTSSAVLFEASSCANISMFWNLSHGTREDANAVVLANGTRGS